jgi:hypothetical protein
MNEIAPYSSTGLVPHNMDEALRLAEFMARARTVPKHLQDSPGDCLMAIEQAMRWGMSPFAVAQATSVISGRLMFEGKLVAAAVESSGAIVGSIDYTFAGEGEGRSVTVSATRRGETNPRTVTVTLKEARTNNEMWRRQPDQQLCYHGVRVWARRWTPAVILGVYSREEMGPVIEGEVVPAEASPERQAINDEIPMRPAAAATPRAPRKIDPTVYDTSVADSASQQNQKNGADRQRTDEPAEKPQRTRGSFLDALEIALRDATSADEVDRIVCSEDVMRAKETFQNGHKQRLDKLIADALAKWWTEPTDEELGEVEIEGAEKVGAGD